MAAFNNGQVSPRLQVTIPDHAIDIPGPYSPTKRQSVNPLKSGRRDVQRQVPSCPHFAHVTSLPTGKPKAIKGQKLVIVGDAPSMLMILHSKSEHPFDLQALLSHCDDTLCRELPEFYLAVEAFQACTDESHYEEEVDWLLSEFILETAPRQINIDVRPRKEAEALVRECKASKVYNRAIFDTIKNDIYKLMLSDVYPKFLNSVTLRRRLALSRQEALWFLNLKDLTLRKFFSFPNPINENEARCHNLCCMILVLTGVLLYAHGYTWGRWILVYLLYGFTARMLCGPRVDPQAFMVLFVISPTIAWLFNVKPKFTSGVPKHFAQMVGFCFSLTGLVLIFLDYAVAAYVVYGFLCAAAFAAGVLNFCLACELIYIFVRFGWLPKEFCEDCTIEYCQPVDEPKRRRSSFDGKTSRKSLFGGRPSQARRPSHDDGTVTGTSRQSTIALVPAVPAIPGAPAKRQEPSAMV
ncbi:hypothetical protein BC832DRAFT_42986 [Gaertneriomyces semiglobifer]|nr:hypothetical protein BC832DRAFT_42986 [Gaertneriomyces semiglobifer]